MAREPRSFCRSMVPDAADGTVWFSVTVKRTVTLTRGPLARSGSGSRGKKHSWGCKPTCTIAYCTATVLAQAFAASQRRWTFWRAPRRRRIASWPATQNSSLPVPSRDQHRAPHTALQQSEALRKQSRKQAREIASYQGSGSSGTIAW